MRGVQGECPWALLLAVAQKVDSQASSLFRQGRRTSVCTVFLDRQVASAALAGLGVALRQSAVRSLASFQELARGCLSATGAQVPLDALRARQLPGARMKVVIQMELLAAFQRAPLAVAHSAQPSAALLATPDESERRLEVSLQQAQGAQLVLQPEEPLQALQQER